MVDAHLRTTIFPTLSNPKPTTINRWEKAAFERSKMAYVNAGATVGKSLERATCSKITAAMLGPDPRFRCVFCFWV